MNPNDLIYYIWGNFELGILRPLLIAWDRSYLHRQDTKPVRCENNKWVLCWHMLSNMLFLLVVSLFLGFFVSSCLFFFPLFFGPCVSCCNGFIVILAIRCRHRQASVEWYPSTGASFCSSSKVLGRHCGGKVVDSWMTHGTNSRWTNSESVGFWEVYSVYIDYEANWFNLTSCVTWVCFIYEYTIIHRHKHIICIFTCYIHIWGDWETLKEKPNPKHAYLSYLLQRGPFPECFT